jgi:hypothetical protein
MAVVSIDLAARCWRDIGIAILSGSPTRVRVDLVQPQKHGLTGTPDVQRFVQLCLELAAQTTASLILIDGPQGWRASSSRFEHMRVCERCTRTPGKTGIPGVVLPRPFARMVRFSIDVFDMLARAGWPRFSGTWPLSQASVETFPTHAWRVLDLPPLPGKKQQGIPLDDWARRLSESFGVKWPRPPTHDELQAVVAGVGGLMLHCSGVAACDVHGLGPFLEAGTWREGYILSPKWPANRRLHPTAAASLQANTRCFCGRRG